MCYFKVVAKCGHVGKGMYYPCEFYVNVANGKEAAALVREFKRVKHHNKNAILSVDKVTEDQYLAGLTNYNDNPYFYCRNRQQQLPYMDEIRKKVIDERKFEDDDISEVYLCKKDHFSGKSKLRDPKKFVNRYLVDNYCIVV